MTEQERREIMGVSPCSEIPNLTHAAMSEPLRRHLPETRESLVHKFSVSGTEGYLIVGLYEDGRPGELFIKIAKQGSTLGGMANTIGILTSICLQNGVSVETLAKKLGHMQFEPRGFSKNPDIGVADSLVDYIFRWLALTFPTNEESL